MIRMMAWWIGAVLLGAWWGLEAHPAYGGWSSGTLEVALEAMRQLTGWGSCLSGCIAITHARRLLRD
jgi:hypothetical protein